MIDIFTDGACSGNPGPGGWAYVLRFGGHKKEASGSERDTTNNRMELRASIAALEALTAPCEVDLFTDSTYLRDGSMLYMIGVAPQNEANTYNNAFNRVRSSVQIADK